jgi:hypothetical protein
MYLVYIGLSLLAVFALLPIIVTSCATWKRVKSVW